MNRHATLQFEDAMHDMIAVTVAKMLAMPASTHANLVKDGILAVMTATQTTARSFAKAHVMEHLVAIIDGYKTGMVKDKALAILAIRAIGSLQTAGALSDLLSLYPGVMAEIVRLASSVDDDIHEAATELLCVFPGTVVMTARKVRGQAIADIGAPVIQRLACTMLRANNPRVTVMTMDTVDVSHSSAPYRAFALIETMVETPMASAALKPLLSLIVDDILAIDGPSNQTAIYAAECLALMFKNSRAAELLVEVGCVRKFADILAKVNSTPGVNSTFVCNIMDAMSNYTQTVAAMPDGGVSKEAEIGHMVPGVVEGMQYMRWEITAKHGDVPYGMAGAMDRVADTIACMCMMSTNGIGYLYQQLSAYNVVDAVAHMRSFIVALAPNDYALLDKYKETAGMLTNLRRASSVPAAAISTKSDDSASGIKWVIVGPLTREDDIITDDVFAEIRHNLATGAMLRDPAKHAQVRDHLHQILDRDDTKNNRGPHHGGLARDHGKLLTEYAIAGKTLLDDDTFVRIMHRLSTVDWLGRFEDKDVFVDHGAVSRLVAILHNPYGSRSTRAMALEAIVKAVRRNVPPTAKQRVTERLHVMAEVGTYLVMQQAMQQLRRVIDPKSAFYKTATDVIERMTTVMLVTEERSLTPAPMTPPQQ